MPREKKRRSGRRSPLAAAALIGIGLVLTGGLYAGASAAMASTTDTAAAQTLTVEDGKKLFQANAYASAFYITTGFHALHVTGGLIAFLLVIGRAYAVKNFGHKEATSAIVVSYYWHFVDVVWIALFIVIYFLK